jgi:hypothetical protein
MRKLLLPLICIMATSCGLKVGPHNLRQDAVTYNEAVQKGIDRQLLLNIVRLRYHDNPSFLDIGVVSASYDFKRVFNNQFETGNTDFPSIGWKPTVGLEYSEKPTTTYNPLTGKGFVEQLLTPIRFDTFSHLNASGWRTDRLLRCCIQRMNNVRNAPTATGPTPLEVPEYEEFIELANIFQELDSRDALHIAKKHDKEGKPYYMLQIERSLADPLLMDHFWSHLELNPGTYEFYLTRHHGRQHRGDEITIQTRSPLGVFYFLSHGVNIPISDEMDGRVTLTTDEQGNVFDWNQVLGNLFQVYTHPMKLKKGCPPCQFVSICYRGTVFYIDDRDLSSKSTFSLITQLLALQSGCPEQPLLTLPIGPSL